MALADRLKRLRGQVGQTGAGGEAPAAEPAPPASESDPVVPLAERIRRASVGQPRASARSCDESQLAEQVGAQVLDEGVLLVERFFEDRLRHGRLPLGAIGHMSGSLIADLVGGDAAAESGPIVCLDTETSGLSGGSGTWVFLTGLLAREPGGWRLRQYLLTRLDAESAYLGALGDALAGIGTLVTYNGRSFDMPLLATRYRMCACVEPLGSDRHADLLFPVRRAFAPVWPDCRLGRVENRLLGFVREDDLPGWAAPQAWLDWIRQGRADALAGVLRHNRWDLLSLAVLLPALEHVFREPGSVGADVRGVAAHHQGHGREDEALRLLREWRSQLSVAGALDLARMHRRRGEWAQACAVWKDLALQGDPEATECLAKYHEHQSRDLAQALFWARRLPEGEAKQHRCERLEGKSRPGSCEDE